MTRKRRTRQNKNRTSSSLVTEIVAISLLAFAALLTFSLWWIPHGMGLFGLALRQLFFSILGRQGSALLVGVLLIISLKLLLVPIALPLPRWEIPCSILLFLTILTGLQLKDGILPLPAWVHGTAGGFVGNAMVWAITSIFGPIGAWVVLTACAVVSWMGLTRLSLAMVLQKAAEWVKTRVQECSFPERVRTETVHNESAERPKATEITIGDYNSEQQEPLPSVSQTEEPPAWSVEPEIDQPVEQLPLPVALPSASGDSSYVLPPLTLLHRPVRRRQSKSNREILDNSRILETTLQNFGIQAQVVHATRGPAVTRYEIQTAPGTKVSRVTSLADDIALSLACSEVRIEAPIPGKAAIGIEVPNKTIATVLLREVLDSAHFQAASSSLTVALGKDITGKAVVADLAEMPHLLIAGATGSGKSVCINSMIVSILYKARPSEVRFLLIDPKMVELSCYNGIPHLLAPVVNQPKKAAAALQWATGEMEKRYRTFAQAGVRDITRYNEWATSAGKEKMPLIIIIIDELADLMMVARADVEDAICRLAQMARAAGMHLVIGTQRPSTDVITGLIKANIPSRISFAVSSATDSRVILDMGGAEKLLGKGDMLFAPVGINKPTRVQGAYVSNREVENLVDFVSSQMDAQYVESLVRLKDATHSAPVQDRDELFTDAIRVVVEAGQGSVSLLQRRLRVGYTRAARIIDQLEEAGVVGPYEGSKPRQVYKNHELVKNLLESGKKQQSM